MGNNEVEQIDQGEATSVEQIDAEIMKASYFPSSSASLKAPSQ